MNLPRPYSQSAYMEFSKLKSTAKYNLATSGVLNCPLAELDFRVEDLDLHGSNSYGYPPLLEAIAKMKGVTPEWVVRADGTSMANHLALAALFAPGDEVLIEEPTYELILSTALYLGAKVKRFRRRVEDNYALDPEEVAKHLTPQTRLIVLTNMHNPSSVLASEASLRAIGELANSVGARVLVDEVYLEALHHPPVASSIHKLSRRADALLDANRKALVETLGSHPAIELTIPPLGTTVFPRLIQGDVAGFCDFLREKYETSVVPGVYFERPEHFRVGIPGEIEMTREGLSRLAAALHEWRG